MVSIVASCAQLKTMGCHILLILLATIESTIAKDVQSHFLYKVDKPASHSWIHPHLRLLEGQRSRREVDPETTGVFTALTPVAHEVSSARPSVIPTSVAPSIALPTTKFVPRTVTTVVPLTIDNRPVPVSENSSLLSAPLGSTLQPTTPNFTIFEDDHRYYRSRTATAEEQAMFWIDEKTMYAASRHDTLSESYRSAATIKLTFTFTFYGHEVNQITIATGGFLYMSEFLHQWLTATQYIAPLMANFDTQVGNSSHIRYWDNGTVFVVWWEDVYLQDNHDGFFSFQVMLHKDGRIIFNYKQVPSTSPSTIPTQRHPVKVGLSDAYYVDKPTSSGDSDTVCKADYEETLLGFFGGWSRALKFTAQIPIDVNRIVEDQHPVKVGISDAFVVTKHLLYLRQRTIYEYHRVEINMSQVLNNSAIIITPLPTCSSLKTCEDCINMSSTVTAAFQCHWCPGLDRCSDGLDRNRQEWLESKCDISANSTCSQLLSQLTAKATKGVGSGPVLASTTSTIFTKTSIINSTFSQSFSVTPSSQNDSTTTPSSAVVTPTRNCSLVMSVNSSGEFPDTVEKCAAAQKNNWIGSRMLLRSLAPSGGVSIATVVIITAVLVIIGSVGVWLVYAYKNPNSRSGLWLIQHRPNNLIERVRQARRGSRISSKYEVAMQPEAESFA